jgi:hypothetical protein
MECPAHLRPVRVALLFVTLLIGLALAYVMVEVVGDLKVTVFQPFRMATIARGLALVAMSGRCLVLWNRGTLPSRSRALLLTSGLTGDWAFVVASAVELAASLRDALPAGRQKAVAGLAAFGVLGYGLVFLARHDTESGEVPLLIALAGAWLVGWLVPRLRRGWTVPRLTFAVVACWAFPLAALVIPLTAGPDDPLSRSLAERCRFVPVPTDDVERLAVWARENTPSDARFITPPGPKTFRLWSGRAVAFNRAASPYHAEGLKDWSDRFRAHVGFTGSTAEFVRAYLADRHGFESRYASLTPEELARLAAGQGAEFVLAHYTEPRMKWPHEHPGPLLVRRVSGRYAIYQLDPGGMVACATCQEESHAHFSALRR